MNRKDDHISGARKQKPLNNDFDRIRFIHRSLPQTSKDKVDLKSRFSSFIIPYPLYINAMTGGSETAKSINKALATIADYFNLPLALGSASAAIKEDKWLESYQVVSKIHTGLTFANIGADKTLADAEEAIHMINADLLQIHVNAPQEMIMPEGERDFTKWLDNIETIVKNVPVPVIVKEVGFGMDKSTVAKLKAIGVKTVDVSGSGGTNFALIENERRQKPYTTLNTWGLSTVESLLEANQIQDIEVLASGGIRHAMDIAKALTLGAKAVGMSGWFLRQLDQHPLKTVIENTEHLFDELKTIMTLLGVNTIDAMRDVQVLFDSELTHYCNQRNLT